MCPLWPDNDFWSALPADYGGINTEASALDMINRYKLERANGAQTLLKVRLWDYNGVDMDYKMDETERCLMEHVPARVSERQDHIGLSDDTGPNKLIILLDA